MVLSFNPRPPEFHPDARWGGCCWLLTRKRGGRSNTLDAGSTGNACRCFRDPTPCLFHPPAEEVQSPRDRGSRYETERSYAVSLESQLLHPREPWRLQFKTYRPAYVLGSMPRCTRVVAPGERQPAVHDRQAGGQEAGPSDRDSCLDGRACATRTETAQSSVGDMGS